MASANAQRAASQRSQAELLFSLCKQTDPDSLSLKLKLAHLLQISPAQEARTMSAILLRRQLTRDDSYIWPRLSPTTQSSLNRFSCPVFNARRSNRFPRSSAIPSPSSPPKSCLTTAGRSSSRSCSGDRDRFQDLLPAMMRTLMESLNNGNEATAQEALELFIELAGTEPRFLRRQIVEVVGSMLRVAEAESLEEGTRHLAIEFVITLAEASERAPGMMRKLPQFISRLLAILRKMVLDIEDDPSWHTAETGYEDAGESGNYSVGQECLDRLAISLGGNTIVPVASEQLLAYLDCPCIDC